MTSVKPIGQCCNIVCILFSLFVCVIYLKFQQSKCRLLQTEYSKCRFSNDRNTKLTVFPLKKEKTFSLLASQQPCSGENAFFHYMHIARKKERRRKRKEKTPRVERGKRRRTSADILRFQAVQKDVNLIDLVKSFPPTTWLQNKNRLR